MFLKENTQHAIIFFDGLCNLCSQTVRFIIRHDTKGYFRFISLQSEMAQHLMAGFNTDSKFADSIQLLQNNVLYSRSTAALRICKKLDGLYFLLYIFILVPPFIRNMVYDFIARNRYRWFGKGDSCMMPGEAENERFLT